MMSFFFFFHDVFLILRFGKYNGNFTGASLNLKKKNHINFPPVLS